MLFFFSSEHGGVWNLKVNAECIENFHKEPTGLRIKTSTSSPRDYGKVPGDPRSPELAPEAVKWPRKMGSPDEGDCGGQTSPASKMPTATASLLWMAVRSILLNYPLFPRPPQKVI